MFLKSLTDAAFLTRIHAGRGLWLLDRKNQNQQKEDREKVLSLLQDEDPRVRQRVAQTLVEAGDPRGLPEPRTRRLT